MSLEPIEPRLKQVAVLFADVVGSTALGGRLDRLGDLQFHWAWLAVAGLVVQVALFSPVFATSATATP